MHRSRVAPSSEPSSSRSRFTTPGPGVTSRRLADDPEPRLLLERLEPLERAPALAGISLELGDELLERGVVRGQRVDGVPCHRSLLDRRHRSEVRGSRSSAPGPCIVLGPRIRPHHQTLSRLGFFQTSPSGFPALR